MKILTFLCLFYCTRTYSIWLDKQLYWHGIFLLIVLKMVFPRFKCCLFSINVSNIIVIDMDIFRHRTQITTNYFIQNKISKRHIVIFFNSKDLIGVFFILYTLKLWIITWKKTHFRINMFMNNLYQTDFRYSLMYSIVHITRLERSENISEINMENCRVQ